LRPIRNTTPSPTRNTAGFNTLALVVGGAGTLKMVFRPLPRRATQAKRDAVTF
jgi:hypothetical protein